MLSLVIPVFNELQSLEPLHGEICEVAAAAGFDLEIIFVDDGSTDNSWNAILRLAASDPSVRGIRFRRNFGKASALNAGFAEAVGDPVMTLDADLQDDPHEIPRFLRRDGESTRCSQRLETSSPRSLAQGPPSRLFNWMVEPC